MKRYMKVGTILHVSYKEVGSGEGPILECLKKIVTDPYFEAVEVAHKMCIRDRYGGRRCRNNTGSDC